MNIFHVISSDPMVLVPILIFFTVFALVIAVTQRQSNVAGRLAHHQIRTPGASVIVAPTRPSFRLPRFNAFDRLAAFVDNEQAQLRARTLLKRAGSPMTPDAYAQMRRLFLFILAPALAGMAFLLLGRELLGIGAAVMMLVTIPRLPGIYLMRRAKKRAKEMDSVIPDALDLLVVCVESGQSLAAGLMQVSSRMNNVAAEEFRYLLADMNSGLSRRDAFLALADRCQSEALGIACNTIVQADKVGMSIAGTLRTLSDMMRARRRRAAETKARQAPIKMMPVLVGFMLPTMLALLLGPVALEVMEAFK